MVPYQKKKKNQTSKAVMEEIRKQKNKTFRK